MSQCEYNAWPVVCVDHNNVCNDNRYYYYYYTGTADSAVHNKAQSPFRPFWAIISAVYLFMNYTEISCRHVVLHTFSIQVQGIKGIQYTYVYYGSLTITVLTAFLVG